MNEPLELFVLECPVCKRRYFVSKDEFCQETRGAFKEYACPFGCGPGAQVKDLAYGSKNLDSAIFLIGALYKKSHLLSAHEPLSGKEITALTEKVRQLLTIEGPGRTNHHVNSIEQLTDAGGKNVRS